MVPQHPPLGILLMASHRDYLLDLILEQIRAEFPNHHIVLNLDRPSAAVARFGLRHEHDDDITITTFGPVVDSVGEHFPSVRNSMLRVLREVYAPEYVMIWDDDQLWARCDEPRELMRDGIDLLEAQDIFFWDSTRHVAIHGFLDKHWAVQLFRNDPDDWFDETLVQHATAAVQARGMRYRLRTPLLNFGLLTAAERRRTFELYKRAGKIDKFTLSFMARPELRRYTPTSKQNWLPRVTAHLTKRGILGSCKK